MVEKGDKEILQRHLIDWIVHDVFNSVTSDDVLRIEEVHRPNQKEIWYYKGKPLELVQVAALKAQAGSFKDSDLWRILKTELEFQAQERGLKKSQTEQDILASKLLLYLVSVLQTKLEKMSS